MILESNGDVTPPAGETYETFELLNGNLTIPQKDTYYNCRLFEFPTLSSKHHMVKVKLNQILKNCTLTLFDYRHHETEE